jgi:hypothetical protein
MNSLKQLEVTVSYLNRKKLRLNKRLVCVTYKGETRYEKRIRI